jgi:hypothetical protein
MAVVGAELKPGGREHRDRRNEHGRRGQAGRPTRDAGFERPHAAGRQPRRSPAGEQQRGELHAHHEAAEEEVGAARDHLDERPERRATEREQQAHRERGQQGAGVGVRGPGKPRQPEPERREHGHDGQPAVVEQLPRDQPVQHETRAVAVDESAALQRLVDRRPPPLLHERDDHPRRREQRTAEEDRSPPQPGHERPAGHERPDEQHRQREVAGLEVQCDGERGQQDRFEVAAPVADRSPAPAPCERQRPRRPQLRPDAEPRPHVGVLLVADPRGAHQERSHRGRGGRRRPARPERAGRQVDADRPQRQKQVQRPAKRHVRPDQQAERAGEDGGQALVVKELRRPLPEEREPARERQVPGAQLRRREAHHLLVQRAVV